MADPVADIGHLTSIWMDPANGVTFAQHLLMTSITPPGPSAESVDTTDLLDTVTQTLSGILTTMSDLTFTFNWEVNNAMPNLLYTAQTSGAVAAWKIIIPHATPVNMVFSGWVVSLAPGNLEQNTPITNTATIRPTTVITLS